MRLLTFLKDGSLCGYIRVCIWVGQMMQQNHMILWLKFLSLSSVSQFHNFLDQGLLTGDPLVDFRGSANFLICGWYFACACFGERESTHSLSEKNHDIPPSVCHWSGTENLSTSPKSLLATSALLTIYSVPRIFVDLIALSSVMFWSESVSSHLAGKLYWAITYLCNIDQNLNTTCLSKKKKPYGFYYSTFRKCSNFPLHFCKVNFSWLVLYRKW